MLNEFLGIIAGAPKASQQINIGKFFTTVGEDPDFKNRVAPFRKLSNWPALAKNFSPTQLKAIDANFFLTEAIFNALGHSVVLKCDKLFFNILIEWYQNDENSFYLDFFASNKDLVKRLFYNKKQCKAATQKAMKTLIDKKSVGVLAEVPGCVKNIPEGSFAVEGELPKEVLRLMKAKQLEEYIYDQKNCVYLDLSVMEKKLSGVKVNAACFDTALKAY